MIHECLVQKLLFKVVVKWNQQKYIIGTLPKTNIAPENGPYSNHPFSGAMLVSGGVKYFLWKQPPFGGHSLVFGGVPLTDFWLSENHRSPRWCSVKRPRFCCVTG